jgi:hypothetical protein
MTTFHVKATGYHTYNGTGTNNTLSYADDPDSVTINLTTDTVTKGSYQDSFSDIQTFVGNASAVDAIVFSGASNQYTIVDHTNGSITVTDTEAGRDGTVKLDDIENLQFTNTTLHPTAPAVVNNSITELYVACFDQAQNPTAEQYWALQLKGGVSIGTIAEDFSKSSEALALYPFLANPTTATTTELDGFVTAI